MFLFLSLAIISLLVQYTLTYVSIPLSKYDNNETQKILSNDSVENDWLYPILYKPISIGNPKQKILLIILSDYYGFYLFTKNKEFKPTNDSINYYNYNLQNSSTAKIKNSEEKVQYYSVSDNFFF